MQSCSRHHVSLILECGGKGTAVAFAQHPAQSSAGQFAHPISAPDFLHDGIAIRAHWLPAGNVPSVTVTRGIGNRFDCIGGGVGGVVELSVTTLASAMTCLMVLVVSAPPLLLLLVGTTHCCNHCVSPAKSKWPFWKHSSVTLRPGVFLHSLYAYPPPWFALFAHATCGYALLRTEHCAARRSERGVSLGDSI